MVESSGFLSVRQRISREPCRNWSPEMWSALSSATRTGSRRTSENGGWPQEFGGDKQAGAESQCLYASMSRLHAGRAGRSVPYEVVGSGWRFSPA